MPRTAALLKRPQAAGKALPRLIAFSDPARTPDVVAFAQDLPPGAALVYRSFGAPDAEEIAHRLRRIDGLILLIGQDASLAERVRADGVHLPERLAQDAGRLKARRPHMLVTCAAHSLAAARRAAGFGAGFGADAAIVSAIFASDSPSAGAPMGPVRLALLTRQVGLPVYALGGVNDKTARRLLNSGVAGLAAVDAFQIPAHSREGAKP